MAKQSWFKELLGTLAPMATGMAKSFRQAASETMEEAQQRIRETTRMVIKSLVVFAILAFGLIFVLVGLSTFIDASQGYMPGTGKMLIGGVFVLLGLFAWMMRK